MASSPEAALSADNETALSPPADSSISPSPPSPQSPPPESSPPSPPASPPPADSSPPPPDSPPPSTTPTLSPPLNNSVSPPRSRSAPVLSPPAPDAGVSQAPPSPALSHSPPRSGSTSGSPGSSSPAASSSSSDYTDLAIIAGIISGGVVILVLIFVCLICSRRRNKQQYYMEHGLPPKGVDQYHKGSKQQKGAPPKDANAKLPVPPGIIGTPVGAWGISPPPVVGQASSEFSSSYSGQHPMHVRTPSPNVGGFGAKSEFTSEELAAATGGFSQANLLGQGGFGFVHKGVLPDGREVAVKSLKSGSGQGEREFQAEVEIISRVHHRHLVSLVGYCIAGQQRMLVYEFVPNKTLEFHLHGEGQPVMDWAARRRIAVGAAKGLAYLHEDCHPRIIHRDIKAANILLDFNFEAMVADFGLAKLTSDNYTHVSTRVMGTFGYLAPEYAASGKLTEKSDVFSFGVMLLELITGRRPFDPTNKIMEDSLVDWARPIMSKALETSDYSELVDPRLEGKYVPHHEMARMIACAAASIRHSARRRPRMSQIVRALDGDSSLEDLNEGVKPGESTAYKPYDTCAYNADIMKFRKMVMSTQDFNNNEQGAATSEYRLNQSSSASSDSGEMDITSPQK